MSSDGGVSLGEGEKRRNIHIIGLGGTIAGTAAGASETTVYKPGTLDAASLIGTVPDLKKIAHLSVNDFMRVGSPDITSCDFIKLACYINMMLGEDEGGKADSEEEEIHGIVVLTGTDTLEELAFFLFHAIKSKKTRCSMSADGNRNLYTSVSVACNKKSETRGVLVVMNNHIFSGCDIVKGDANQIDAFTGGLSGCLGRLHGDEVIYTHKPSLPTRVREKVRLKQGDRLPLVQILYGHPEVLVDLDWYKEKDVKGFVLVGMGAGCWTTTGGEHIQEFIRMNADIPVVASRRPAEGYVGHGTIYGLGNECIGAGDLNPAKARVNLQLLLDRGASREEIMESFVPGYGEKVHDKSNTPIR